MLRVFLEVNGKSTSEKKKNILALKCTYLKELNMKVKSTNHPFIYERMGFFKKKKWNTSENFKNTQKI